MKEGKRHAYKRRGTIRHRPQRLLQVLGSFRSLLILTHDNPDPDAIASGYALRYLAQEKLDIEVVLGFGGIVGRAENSAMVSHLDIELRHVSQLSLDTFEAVALVDTQPGSHNYSLPATREANVVIDHHPPRPEGRRVQFFDCRPQYGATSTILAEYLWLAGLPIPARLATALLFALKTETQDLVRMASRVDIDTYLRLYSLADVSLLAEVQRPKLRPSYYRDIYRGLETAIVHGRVAMCTLDQPATPDMVADLADFLLRLQGVEWSICFGYFGNQMFISVRTSEPGGNAGEVVQKVIGSRGSAGGHDVMAGGRIFSLPLDPSERSQLERSLKARFLRELGGAGEEGHLLLGER